MQKIQKAFYQTSFLKINAKNIVNNSTCYNSVQNPSCIDLVITITLSFQNTVNITVGLSYFHKMVITVLKTVFAKLVPKEFLYRVLKRITRDKFKRELEGKLNENSNLIGEYDYFEKMFFLLLESMHQSKLR